MEPTQIVIAVAGLLATFFAFVGATLIGAVGYFVKNFHSEYKSDKASELRNNQRVDEKITKLAEDFAKRLELLVDKISDKINQLPRGSDSLSETLLNIERDIIKRVDERFSEVDKKIAQLSNNP